MAEFNASFNEENSFDVDMVESEQFGVNLDEQIVVGITENHNELKNRDAPDCHPISAITNLESQLAELKNDSVTPEERESWNNKSRVYRNASGALVITF